MKLHYYPETDSLYIDFKPTPGTETREIVGGLNGLFANGWGVGDPHKWGSSTAATAGTPASLG